MVASIDELTGEVRLGDQDFSNVTMSIQMSPKKEKLLNEMEEQLQALFGALSKRYDKD